jgi:hypothetical protein
MEDVNLLYRFLFNVNRDDVIAHDAFSFKISLRSPW